jgi:hypothetical protein
MEFRSDCATTAAGWVATYTTNGVGTPTTTADVTVPTTTINSVGGMENC